MKKYIWGLYKGIKYSLIEVNKSDHQVVLKPIGTKTHLTLHKLKIDDESDKYLIVKYQGSPLKLPKNSYAPISFNWSSPCIKDVWSKYKVQVAKNLGFLNPDKHATSSQGLLVRIDNIKGYDLGATRIELNKSMSKQKYLNQIDKIGKEIMIPKRVFMIRVILSTTDNEYKNLSNFSFKTRLGKLFIVIEDVIRIKRS